MRWRTLMVGMEVLGREPRASKAPAPTLTIIVSKRNQRSPLERVWIWILESLAILRSGSRSRGAAPAGASINTASAATATTTAANNAVNLLVTCLASFRVYKQQDRPPRNSLSASAVGRTTGSARPLGAPLSRDGVLGLYLS